MSELKNIFGVNDTDESLKGKSGGGKFGLNHGFVAKIEFTDTTLVVSGWVQAGVGSVGGNEMALNGIVAAVPKKSVMKVIEQIKASL